MIQNSITRSWVSSGWSVPHKIKMVTPPTGWTRQYAELQQRSADMDTIELNTARHAIRPDKEYETLQRLQAAYGKKFDSGTLAQSRMDVAEMLNETAEPVSIRQNLQQLQVHQTKQSYEKERGQER